MRWLLMMGALCLTTGCLTAPEPLARPEIRGANGCTRVAPPDVRPRARYKLRMTIDMNEWCHKVAGLFGVDDGTI